MSSSSDPDSESDVSCLTAVSRPPRDGDDARPPGGADDMPLPVEAAAAGGAALSDEDLESPLPPLPLKREYSMPRAGRRMTSRGDRLYELPVTCHVTDFCACRFLKREFGAVVYWLVYDTEDEVLSVEQW